MRRPVSLKNRWNPRLQCPPDAPVTALDLTRMFQFIRHYLLALQFFTRIPVTGRLAEWVGFSPALLRASAAHFPGIGWLVGGVVAVFTWGLLVLLPPSPFAPLVAAVLGTVLSVWMTGAFHEDGLADVADGLGGTLDRNRALEIMKDSRVGAFGAIAVVLVLLAKVALLALLGSLSTALLCVALFLAHVVSRTWPLFTIALLKHVGAEGANGAGSKSKPLADQISLKSLAAAFLWCADSSTKCTVLQTVGPRVNRMDSLRPASLNEHHDLHTLDPRRTIPNPHPQAPTHQAGVHRG